MPDRPLRVGLVGAGSMGALHARVVAANRATELAWVVDPDETRGRELASRFGTDWRPTLELEIVDAVIVAAPTQFHHEIAQSVVSGGVPLLLEKPLANTLTECREIVELARSKEVVLMCGLLERFNPAVRTAAEIAREPLHATTRRHSPYAERIRTGVAGDLLIHDIDMVLRLFGSQPETYACSFGFFEPRSATGSEDVADATLGLPGGRIASMSVSRIAQTKVRSLVVSELGRTIEVDLLRQSITVYRDAGSSEFHEDAGYTQQTIIDIPVIRHLGEPLQLQLDHFCDLIRGAADPRLEIDSLMAPHEVLHRLSAGAAVSS
jgi:predicted dehydrogenase